MIKKKFFGLVCFLGLFLSFNVEAGMLSVSKSGSGYLPSGEYYYYYIYQFSYVSFDKLVSESHNFVFTGALEEEEKAVFRGIEDDWLIYEGKKYLLAIPHKKGEQIYIQKKKTFQDKQWTAIREQEPKWIAISDPV